MLHRAIKDSDNLTDFYLEKILNGITINGLPVYVADDDFIEYLAEQGYGGNIDINEIGVEWDDWAKENII
jgi:hypothetical protein